MLLLSYTLGVYPGSLRPNDDTRKLVGEVCALGIFQGSVMAGPAHQHWTLKTTIGKTTGWPKTSTGHIKTLGGKNGPPWYQHCREKTTKHQHWPNKNTYFVCWLASTNRQGTSPYFFYHLFCILFVSLFACSLYKEVVVR